MGTGTTPSESSTDVAVELQTNVALSHAARGKLEQLKLMLEQGADIHQSIFFPFIIQAAKMYDFMIIFAYVIISAFPSQLRRSYRVASGSSRGPIRSR